MKRSILALSVLCAPIAIAPCYSKDAASLSNKNISQLAESVSTAAGSTTTTTTPTTSNGSATSNLTSNGAAASKDNPSISNSAAAPASSPPTQPLTANQCLVRVRALEPMVPKLIEGARAAIHALIPDPPGYEKTLPPLDKVVQDKDTTNFRNYGGLSEAYFFGDDAEQGQRIYSVFIANAPTMLGVDNTFGAFVQGDIGLLKFMNKDYAGAETYLLPAIKQLEEHLTPAVSNNLIAAYLCMRFIRDRSSKIEDKAEAAKYAKKLVDLTIKQRQPY